MSTTDRRDTQKQAEQLWQREGGHCVSHLVSMLAQADYCKDDSAALEEAKNQAMELASPVDDWEEAAFQEGWSPDPATKGDSWRKHVEGEGTRYAISAEQACRFDDIEPYQREVFEHWIVSDWLADKLAEKGEKVDKDFAGLTVWARTTTGQAVYSDSVMENIAAELHAWREV